MDTSPTENEKHPIPTSIATDSPDVYKGAVPQRTVVFPDKEVHEKHHFARPKGIEMRRELTVEDKALAAAGYQYLDEQKTKGEKHFENVDITEHKLKLALLAEALNTHFDPKDPGSSKGLSDSESKARLEKDGKNVLTPQRKKSTLRRYFDCLNTMFNILLIVAGILEYILLGIDYAVCPIFIEESAF